MPLFLLGKKMEVSKEELYILISSLAAVIGVLWGLLSKNYKQKEEALQTAEKEHKDCVEKLTDLTARVSYLAGKTEGIAQLSTTLIEKLEDISKKIEQ